MKKNINTKSHLIHYKNNLSKSNGGIKGEKLLFNILTKIKLHFNQNPTKKLENLINKMSPGANLSPRYFAGRVSYVPSPIRDTQAHYKVIKWIRESTRIKQNMAEKFTEELIQSNQNNGNLWNLKRKHTNELRIARLNMKKKFKLHFSKKRKIKIKTSKKVKKKLTSKEILKKITNQRIMAQYRLPPNPMIRRLKKIIKKKKRNNLKYHSEIYKIRHLHYKAFIQYTSLLAPFYRRLPFLEQNILNKLKKNGINVIG